MFLDGIHSPAATTRQQARNEHGGLPAHGSLAMNLCDGRFAGPGIVRYQRRPLQDIWPGRQPEARRSPQPPLLFSRKSSSDRPLLRDRGKTGRFRLPHPVPLAASVPNARDAQTRRPSTASRSCEAATGCQSASRKSSSGTGTENIG